MGLSEEEVKRIKAKVASPDIRPGEFDVTLEAWLKRISLWGSIQIEHYEPEFKRKKKITQEKFIELATDEQLLQILGGWDTERKDINKLEMFREYIGNDGKKKRESFYIYVEFSAEIKKAMK